MDTVDEIFDYMRGQMMSAARMGLWADSALVILKPGEEEAKLFEVVYNGEPQDGNMSVDFKETKEGRVFHLGIAARGEWTGGRWKLPGPNQFIGTVHVHT